MPSITTSQQTATKAIRLRLVARDKNQQWLADELGESPFWVSRRMSGTTKWDVDDLDRIAMVFGTSLDGLMATATAVAS